MNPIINTSLSLVGSLLDIVSTHQKRKYKKDFHKLLRRVRDEEKKSFHERDDGLLDDLYDELDDLLRSFKQEIESA